MDKAERDRLRIQPTTHPGTVIMKSADMLSLLDTCDKLEAENAKLRRNLDEWKRMYCDDMGCGD